MTTQAKTIIIAAVIVLALAAGAFIYFTPPAAAPGPENPPAGTSTTTPAPSLNPQPVVPTATPPTGTPPATTPPPSGITMAQVATHASASSCWTVIRGSVYNLTTWISRHPGGSQAILQLCGKDGTVKFEAQHGGSAKPENMLASFKIGVLAI